MDKVYVILTCWLCFLYILNGRVVENLIKEVKKWGVSWQSGSFGVTSRPKTAIHTDAL